MSCSKYEMEEVGKVVEVNGDTVKVELEASEKCGHCSVKALCHPGSDSKMYIEAINEVGAELGDKVKIGVAPGISIFSAFLLFIAPIISFFAVFTVVRMLTREVQPQNENLAVLGGFGGLILFFLFLIKVNRRVAKSRKFYPVVKEIL